MLTFDVLRSEYMITGRREALQEPKLEFWVHLIGLPSDDRHNVQLDPQCTPNPAVNKQLSCEFHLPLDMDITYESYSITVMCAIPYGAFVASPRSSKNEDV